MFHPTPKINSYPRYILFIMGQNQTRFYKKWDGLEDNYIFKLESWRIRQHILEFYFSCHSKYTKKPLVLGFELGYDSQHLITHLQNFTFLNQYFIITLDDNDASRIKYIAGPVSIND